MLRVSVINTHILLIDADQLEVHSPPLATLCNWQIIAYFVFCTTLKTGERDSARSVSFDISYLVGHRLSDDMEKVQKGNLLRQLFINRTEHKQGKNSAQLCKK